MKKIAIGLLGILLFTLPSFAQYKITASITVTNLTTNGMMFTLNGSTRTFTNNVFNSATQVGTNPEAPGCGSKTNLLTQIRTAPFSQVTSADTGSNSFNLIGNADLPMAFTLTAGYASISYSTQTVANVIAAQLPVSALPTPQARTNVASGIVGAANAPENTNAISPNSIAASELMGLANSQTVVGVKLFTNAAGQWFGIISNSPSIGGTIGLLLGGQIAGSVATNLSSISGDVSWLRNGVISNATMIWGTSGTNAIITSSGLAQFNLAIAVQAFGGTKFNFGDVGLNGDLQFYAQTNGSSTPILLYNANPTNMNFVVPVSFNSSNSIGTDLRVGGNTFIGTNLTVTGSAVVSGGLVVSGGENVQGLRTNAAFTGTNNFPAGADIAFCRYAISSLANGNNAAVVIGTNKVAQLSGPTGAFAINGIANGRDGKEIMIYNRTGQAMTIANESGIDPVAGNRLLTGLSGDFVITNNPGCVGLWYDANASRWLVEFHN